MESLDKKQNRPEAQNVQALAQIGIREDVHTKESAAAPSVASSALFSAAVGSQYALLIDKSESGGEGYSVNIIRANVGKVTNVNLSLPE